VSKKTKKTVRTVRTSRGVKEYTHLGCPLTRNRTAWCYRLCVPDPEGKGECGRLAPHGLKSRTQHAIEEHNRALRAARLEELETGYLAAPDPEGREPGVKVVGGEAEVVLRLVDGDVADGAVSPPLCFRGMHDAARLAVASLVNTGTVSTVEFNVKLTDTTAHEVLIARSLFVGQSDDQYLTESVLADGDGRELGRGTGTFTIQPT
jgi:hypothetical protein